MPAYQFRMALSVFIYIRMLFHPFLRFFGSELVCSDEVRIDRIN